MNLLTNSISSILDTFVVWLLRPPKTNIAGYYSLEIHANKGITVNQSNHYFIGVNKETKKRNLQKMSLSQLLGYATTMHSMRNDLVMKINNTPKFCLKNPKIKRITHYFQE